MIHSPRVLTRDQIDRIRRQLEAASDHPGDWHRSVMVELMATTAARWGEAAATVATADTPGNTIDWTGVTIAITGSITSIGAWRPDRATPPRVVPMPPELLDELIALVQRRPRAGYVFSPVDGSPPQRAACARAWYAAIDRANTQIDAENQQLSADHQIPPIPRVTQHALRDAAVTRYRYRNSGDL